VSAQLKTTNRRDSDDDRWGCCCYG